MFVDCLQYCNWSRRIFEEMHPRASIAGLALVATWFDED